MATPVNPPRPAAKRTLRVQIADLFAFEPGAVAVRHLRAALVRFDKLPVEKALLLHTVGNS